MTRRRTKRPDTLAEMRRAEAKTLYLQGWIDSDIARALGITRQAVNKYTLDFPEREWAYIHHGVAGVSPVAIRGWIEDGLIETSPSGLVKPREVGVVAAELRARKCASCDQPVNSIDRRARWCRKHSASATKYRYPYVTPYERQKMQQATNRWAKRNPWKMRQLNRRSSYTYQLVKQGVPREEARRLSVEKFPKEKS